MKKFVKLSLAAAVASTGFVSANAGALEDAIKNTSILGYATYRYDDRQTDNAAITTANNDAYNRHKIAVGLISKVNDNLSYTYVGAVTTGEQASTGGEELSYFGGGLYTVYNYFTYTGINNVTVNVGQQTIDTPQTDTFDDIGATQEGTGITAVTTVGGVTLVAGAMNQTKLAGEGSTSATAGVGSTIATGAENLFVVAAKTKLNGISLDANYLTLEDVADSYTIGAKTSVDLSDAKVSLKARYTGLNLDGSTDQALWYVGASAKMGAFGLSADYIATAKDGGRVAFDDDGEAVNQGWALNLNDTNIKGDMIKVGASYAINSAYTLSALHVAKTMDAANSDSSETLGQLTWKPSKNFYAYLRYGTVDADASSGDIGAKGQRGRVHMTYNF